MILIYQPDDMEKFMLEFNKQRKYNRYEVMDENAYKIIYLNKLTSINDIIEDLNKIYNDNIKSIYLKIRLKRMNSLVFLQSVPLLVLRK